jgi:hypothetical protein
MKEYINNLIDTKNSLVAPAVLFGIFFLLFGFVVRSGIIDVANKDQSITVTGSTERIVSSDTAKWTISVTERAYGENAGANASRVSGRSIDTVKNYLNKNGIKDEEISIQASSLSPICELSSQGYENCSIGVKGQIANQSIVVETSDVEKVKSLNGKIQNEVNGVNINNNLVEYFYNKLKDIRVDMLSEATANAKDRAVAVAKAGGASVGNITSLSSGVFQVTQKNSVSVDDYGAYDTSSIEKKITATVKVNFSVK